MALCWENAQKRTLTLRLLQSANRAVFLSPALRLCAGGLVRATLGQLFGEVRHLGLNLFGLFIENAELFGQLGDRLFAFRGRIRFRHVGAPLVKGAEPSSGRCAGPIKSESAPRYAAGAGTVIEGPARNAPSDDDLFYAAWADDLEKSVEGLLDEYNATGRADDFRVLHGRLCEELSLAELAAPEIPATSVDNNFRHARRRLGELLQQQLRRHVSRYVEPGEVDEEFQREWRGLGEFLQSQGDLEAAIRRVDTEPVRNPATVCDPR